MKIFIDPVAAAELMAQLRWGADRFGIETTTQTLDRVNHFIETYLPTFPLGAKYLPALNVFEVLIPRTPFILFYRQETEDRIRVLAVFHQSQDRHSSQSARI